MPTPRDFGAFDKNGCCVLKRSAKSNEWVTKADDRPFYLRQADELVAIKEEMISIKDTLKRLAELQLDMHDSVSKGFVQMEKGFSEMATGTSFSTVAAKSPDSPPAACVELREDNGNMDPMSRRSSDPCVGLRENDDNIGRLSMRASVASGEPDYPSRKSSSGKVGRSLSKSNFGGLNASAADEFDLLMAVFELDERQQEEREAREEHKKQGCKYYCDIMASMGKEDWEIVMDSCMGFCIIANAIFLGLSMDMETASEPVWFVVNISFTILFIVELFLKVSIHGLKGQFCGPHMFSNCFDACLICVDALQLAIETTGATLAGVPSASLFRIIRLVKLTRIIRLLKFPMFHDLLCMLQGMLGGLRTLAWAMVLFLIAVYSISLVARELLGRREVDGVSDMFDSVPRAMLTVFRCSFGDCSTQYGTPVFEHVNSEYGVMFSFSYCLFLFAITIGLFNVISAIFVESTMAAASALQLAKKARRLQDDLLWSTCVSTLVKRLMHVSPDHKVPDKLSDAMDEILDLDVPAFVVEELAEDPEALAALERLDVDREDHPCLADILDPDNGGTIRVVELIDGIKRLRGEPRRGDIITIDLMIRSLQRDLALIKKAICPAEDETSKRGSTQPLG